MLTYFIVSLFGGSLEAYFMWASLSIGIGLSIVLFGLMNNHLKVFLISTFLTVYVSIDVGYFMKDHPWGECVTEQMSITSKTLGENYQTESEVCRYKFNINDSYGEWAIKNKE